jgi:hypothetical protein
MSQMHWLAYLRLECSMIRVIQWMNSWLSQRVFYIKILELNPYVVQLDELRHYEII